MEYPHPLLTELMSMKKRCMQVLKESDEMVMYNLRKAVKEMLDSIKESSQFTAHELEVIEEYNHHRLNVILGTADYEASFSKILQMPHKHVVICMRATNFSRNEIFTNNSPEVLENVIEQASKIKFLSKFE